MSQLVECVPNFSEGNNQEGAALASMVGQMTYGRRQFEHLDATMRRLIPPFHMAMSKLTALVDADAEAFAAYMVAAKALEMGVFGAYFNVLINLKDVTDDMFKDQVRQRVSNLLQEAKAQAALVLDHLETRKE
ncbi:Formimidoyltransferase-cyclodeaminase [Tupaia chinensis]|uniref:Formimidoyltransferase-cyclodeaminase n=1 Tax=Tupaia chinensis TaxID=246437 RepID=L8YDT4_TUPCH|nr:Formimidoyltransferase-cyclodeaminase [Tupaia chinensis]